MKLGTPLKSLLLLTFLLLPLTACGETSAPVPANDAGANFTQGVHYATLPRAINIGTDKNKIEVVEMFWYGCPHCYHLEPALKKWKQTIPADVEFIALPSVLNPRWALHAKVFFAMQMNGDTAKLHDAFFKAIHEQGRNLNSEDAILRFAKSIGVDSAKLQASMNSMLVDKKVRKAQKLGKDYGLTGVPALIVAGKYKLLSGGASSHEEKFQLVDYLINKERIKRK